MNVRNTTIVPLLAGALCAMPASAAPPARTSTFDFDTAQPPLALGQALPFLQRTADGFTAEFSLLQGTGFTVQSMKTVNVVCPLLGREFLWPSSGEDALQIRLDRLARSVTLTYVTLDEKPIVTDMFVVGYLETSSTLPVAVTVGNGEYQQEQYPYGVVTMTASHRPFDMIRVRVAPGTRGIAIEDVKITEAACQADFDGDGAKIPVISIQDMFSFVNTWLNCGLRADFNHDGTQDQQDIFDFLDAWFTGCP